MPSSPRSPPLVLTPGTVPTVTGADPAAPVNRRMRAVTCSTISSRPPGRNVIPTGWDSPSTTSWSSKPHGSWPCAPAPRARPSAASTPAPRAPGASRVATDRSAAIAAAVAVAARRGHAVAGQRMVDDVADQIRLLVAGVLRGERELRARQQVGIRVHLEHVQRAVLRQAEVDAPVVPELQRLIGLHRDLVQPRRER